MGFDDLCDIGLVLGLGISSSGVGKSAATQKLDDPSFTLSKGHHNLLPPKKSTEFYGQDSAVSSLSNVSVKREREIGSEKVDRVWSRVRDEDEDDGSNGRKKLRLTKAQSAVLEESFNHHTTLNPKQKQELAMELKLSPRQVEVWFQNRRARTKLKQTEVEYELLKKCCESLTDENRRLQKELQALKFAKPLYMQLPTASLNMCPSCERLGGAAVSRKAAKSSLAKPHFYNPFTNPSAAF